MYNGRYPIDTNVQQPWNRPPATPLFLSEDLIFNGAIIRFRGPWRWAGPFALTL